MCSRTLPIYSGSKIPFGLLPHCASHYPRSAGRLPAHQHVCVCVDTERHSNNGAAPRCGFYMNGVKTYGNKKENEHAWWSSVSFFMKIDTLSDNGNKRNKN